MRMSLIVVAFFAVSVILLGCTSMRPVEGDANTLRHAIRNGEAVQVGDHVRVITIDGVSHLLEVTVVQERVIEGYDISKTVPAWSTVDEARVAPVKTREDAPIVEISIDDIVHVETQEISVGKTAAAAGGITVGAVILFIVVFLATFSISFQ